MPRYQNVGVYQVNGKYHVVILSNKQEDNKLVFIGQLEDAYQSAFQAVELVRQYNLFN